MKELGIIDDTVEEIIETTNVDILLNIYRLCKSKYKTTFSEFMNEYIEDMFDWMIFDLIRHPIEENSEEIEEE